MDIIIIVIGLIAVALMFAGVWLLVASKAKKREAQVKEMIHLLDRVVEAAVKRKTQLYESLDANDNPALTALLEAANSSPVDISDELMEMQTLWRQLSADLTEFSNQPVQATLQSSVVTTRAAQSAKRITDLAEKTKTKLIA